MFFSFLPLKCFYKVVVDGLCLKQTETAFYVAMSNVVDWTSTAWSILQYAWAVKLDVAMSSVTVHKGEQKDRTKLRL